MDCSKLTNREIDSLVAELLGCKPLPRKSLWTTPGFDILACKCPGGIHGNQYDGDILEFTKDWNAAALVVEKMRADNYMFDCGTRIEKSLEPKYKVGTDWYAQFYDAQIDPDEDFVPFSVGSCGPRAICLAALAVEAQKEQHEEG